VKPVRDHLAHVLSAVTPLAPFEQELLAAHGTVLAADVTAPGPLPAFDNSAMDGYAVRAADVAGASEANPARLAVTGEVRAGSWEAGAVTEGTALRIMTGAPLPAGADTVIPQEWTDQGIATVSITQGAERGRYVRRAGDDVAEGVVLLRAGQVLRAGEIGLLAAAGYGAVTVRPRPRVVVLSTGDELVEPGTALTPGKITDSNSFALACAAREAGGLGSRAGAVSDDVDLLRTTLEDLTARADLIVTSGGVSVGAYDVVKKALGKLGTVEFTRVAMQPGMPQGFGTIGPHDTPLFCLPGNPVSALVSFEVFVRPAIRKLAGFPELHRQAGRAAVATSFESPAGKRQFRPAVLEGSRVRPVGRGGSHQIAAYAEANVLIVVPEEKTAVPQGAIVDIILLGSAIT
jgi:molybdopterin molybdotransferase